jgi:hypothetical protein
VAAAYIRIVISVMSISCSSKSSPITSFISSRNFINLLFVFSFVTSPFQTFVVSSPYATLSEYLPLAYP